MTRAASGVALQLSARGSSSNYKPAIGWRELRTGATQCPRSAVLRRRVWRAMRSYARRRAAFTERPSIIAVQNGFYSARQLLSQLSRPFPSLRLRTRGLRPRRGRPAGGLAKRCRRALCSCALVARAAGSRTRRASSANKGLQKGNARSNKREAKRLPDKPRQEAERWEPAPARASSPNY